MEQVRAVLARARGRVQRVGFRRYALELAQELGLAGWIRNEPDGSVLLLAQGPPGALEAFLEGLKEAPPPAQVRELEVSPAEVEEGLEHFRIAYGPLEEELQEGFGAMQAIFMEYWREFRDFRREFRDYRQEFRDYRQEFRDFRQEFGDFRQEFRDYRGEFQDFRQEFRGVRQEFQEYRQEFRGFASRTEHRLDVINDKLTTILDILVKELVESRRQVAEALELLRKAVEELSRRAG